MIGLYSKGPQKSIPKPLNKVTQLPFYKRVDEDVKFVLNSFDSAKWEDFMKRKLENITQDSQILDKCDAETILDVSAPYRWIQGDDTITITIPKSSGLKLDDIRVDEEGISCENIRGKWFGPVSEIDIFDSTQYRIRFRCKGRWPVLVTSGDVDDYSALLLSIFSTRLGSSYYHQYWASYAAKNNYVPAMLFLGDVALNRKKEEIAAYWFTRSACAGSNKSLVLLGKFLYESDGDSVDPYLAENILVSAIEYDQNSAYLALADLNLRDIKGFKGDRKLAVSLLEKCVEAGEDPLSFILLGNCKINGIGCPIDTEGGKELLNRSAEAALTTPSSPLKVPFSPEKLLSDSRSHSSVPSTPSREPSSPILESPKAPTVNEPIHQEQQPSPVPVMPEDIETPEPAYTPKTQTPSPKVIAIGASAVAVAVGALYLLFRNKRK